MNGPLGELFRLPDFLRLWLVGATGNAMRWLELLASGLFAWEATQSALAVTVVVAVRQLPQLFFGAFVGAISEAVNRKTIVMLALLVPAERAFLLEFVQVGRRAIVAGKQRDCRDYRSRRLSVRQATRETSWRILARKTGLLSHDFDTRARNTSVR